MIYVLAAIFGLVLSVQSFLSEITAGNISHMKNGRQPNAGAAIFPLIPFVPLIFVGIAWVLRTFIPSYASWILLAVFLLLCLFWIASFAKLRAELHRTEAATNHSNDRFS